MAGWPCRGELLSGLIRPAAVRRPGPLVEPGRETCCVRPASQGPGRVAVAMGLMRRLGREDPRETGIFPAVPEPDHSAEKPTRLSRLTLRTTQATATAQPQVDMKTKVQNRLLGSLDPSLNPRS